MSKGFLDVLVSLAPAKATHYRLHRCSTDGVVTIPDLDQDGFPLKPKPSAPPVPYGMYLASFENSAGQIPGHHEVHWQPSEKPYAAPVSPEVSVESGPAVDDTFAAIDFDESANRALTIRKNGELVRDVFGLYRTFIQVIGQRSLEEVRQKTEQADLLAKMTTKMLMDKLDAFDLIQRRLEAFGAPPEPTPWDKIVGSGAPAFAAVAIEMMRAIRGVGPSATSTELLNPPDEKMSRLYDLLGNVGDADRLNGLLQDKEKLQSWMESVQRFMRSERPRKSDEPSEAKKAE